MYSIVNKKISLEKKLWLPRVPSPMTRLLHLLSLNSFVAIATMGIKSKIIPYTSGFPIFQMYDRDSVLSKSELLKNGMVTETSQRMLHFGELTVDDLLYILELLLRPATQNIFVFLTMEKNSRG